MQQQASTNSNFFKLLKEKSNHLNRTFQHFQTEIKSAIHEIIEKQINDDNKSIYKDKINALFSDYSSSINRLEIEYLVKCEQSLQINEAAITPVNTNGSSPTHGILANDDNNDSPYSDSISSTSSSSDSHETHECTQCDVTCSSKYHLQKHIKTEHCCNIINKHKSYSCDECNKIFKYQRLLHVHLLNHHGMTLVECNQCTEKFKHRTELQKHQTSAHTEQKHNNTLSKTSISNYKPYNCHLCWKTFENAMDLSAHKAKQHRIHHQNRDKVLNHNYIDIDMDDDDDDADNESSSSNDSVIKYLHKCHECNLSYTALSSLRRHNKKHHPESVTPLTRNHYKTEKTVDVVCDVCNKVFSHRSLRDHKLRMHSGKTLYKCDECGKTFKIRRNLYSHSRNVHDGYPMECDECDKKFKYVAELKQHLNKEHNGSGSMVPVEGTVGFECNECDICNGVYASKYGLKIHKLTHSAENNFQCEHCSIPPFKLQKYLISHIKTVHKINPWKCDECDETFRIKTDLKKHRALVHINGKTNDNKKQSDTEILDDMIDLNQSKNETLSQTSHSEDLVQVCSICSKPCDDDMKEMIECSECTEQYHCLCVVLD